MNNNTTTTIAVGERSLTVREITIDDIERLRRMFNRLSPDSIYRRFFSPVHEPSRTALLWLTSVDHGNREALVALDGDEIVAVARYDGRSEGNTAEIAVTVEDDWQHLGVGKRLTKRLAQRAIDQGFESFELVVQPDNRAALGLLRKLSPDASVRFDGGEYAASVRLDAAPSCAAPSPVDAS
jgi:ribosomal protein S18 acetylase RimI-like enzyme